MGTKVVFVGSAAFWAFMMGHLVRREVLPYLAYQAPPSYRTILPRRPEVTYLRYRVQVGPQEVGVAETLIVPSDPRQPNLQTRIEMDVASLLSLQGMSEPLGKVRMATETHLDRHQQLRQFQAWGWLGPLYMEASGSRVGNLLHVRASVPLLKLKARESLEFPNDGMIGGNLMPMPAGGMLSPGKKWRTHLMDIDFLTGRPRFTFAYFMVAEERVRLDWKGKQIPVYRVEMRYKPEDVQVMPTMMAWVDEEGRLIQQTIALGRREARMVLDSHEVLSPDQAAAFKWKIEVLQHDDSTSERP